MSKPKYISKEAVLKIIQVADVNIYSASSGHILSALSRMAKLNNGPVEEINPTEVFDSVFFSGQISGIRATFKQLEKTIGAL